MNPGLKVAVVSAYPFHMVDQAHQLHKQGALHRMITSIPHSRVGLPHEFVRTRLRWSVTRRAVTRAMPSADSRLNRQVIRDFDRWSQSQLGDATIVNGLSGFATNTLEAAAARGATVFCDRGSWHILEQKRVLDEEADRIGVPRVYFDPFIVDRELREYQFAHSILVPSEPARQSFIRRGLDANRILKVPYGVDVSAFSPAEGQRTPGAIVSVATVGLRKGHQHLVQAFRMLATQNANLTLVGAINPEWHKRLDLNHPQIRITGPVPRQRVIREFQRASVFVLTSLEEGLALVIGQAMACGLPVIATEATGASELISDGIEGLILPGPPDAPAIARALDSLLSDPERMRAMGAEGRSKVEKFGGWDRYGRQLVRAFCDSWSSAQ